MTKTDFEHDQKISKTLKKICIANLVLGPLSGLLAIIYIAISLSVGILATEDPASGLAVGSLATLGISIPVWIASILICWIYAIMLLSMKYKHDNLNSEKTVWAIFSFVLLHWIAMLIWTVRSKNILSSVKVDPDNVSIDMNQEQPQMNQM